MNAKEFYMKNGFYLFKNLLPKNLVAQVQNDAKRVFKIAMRHHALITEKEPTETEFEQALFLFFKQHFTSFVNCGKQVQHLISLHSLSLSSVILEKLNEFGLEFPNICTRPVLFFNHPKLAKEKVYHTVFPHQDWRSMQGSLDSMVVWIPLMDIKIDHGALKIVPQSHLKGLLAKEMQQGFGKVEDYDEDAFESVETQQGDALFFSSFLVHQSGDNSSEKIRWSCHFRYNNLCEKTFVKHDFPHPYIYKPDPQILIDGFPLQKEVCAVFSQD